MTYNMRVESLNCKGLGSNQKRRAIMEHFHLKRCDVILLQETHTTIKTSQKYQREWKRMAPTHDSVWNSHNSRSCGVAILIKDKLTTKLLDSRIDPAGRLITVQLELGSDKIQLQSMYAADMRPEFFENADMFTFRLPGDHRWRLQHGRTPRPRSTGRTVCL